MWTLAWRVEGGGTDSSGKGFEARENNVALHI